jgi:hypothetical protein
LRAPAPLGLFAALPLPGTLALPALLRRLSLLLLLFLLALRSRLCLPCRLCLGKNCVGHVQNYYKSRSRRHDPDCLPHELFSINEAL